jgi:hypothetical protein
MLNLEKLKPAVYARSLDNLENGEYGYFNSSGRLMWGRVQLVVDKNLFGIHNVYLIDTVEILLMYGLEEELPEQMLQK